MSPSNRTVRFETQPGYLLRKRREGDIAVARQQRSWIGCCITQPRLTSKERVTVKRETQSCRAHPKHNASQWGWNVGKRIASVTEVSWRAKNSQAPGVDKAPATIEFGWALGNGHKPALRLAISCRCYWSVLTQHYRLFNAIPDGKEPCLLI